MADRVRLSRQIGRGVTHSVVTNDDHERSPRSGRNTHGKAGRLPLEPIQDEPLHTQLVRAHGEEVVFTDLEGRNAEGRSSRTTARGPRTRRSSSPTPTTARISVMQMSPRSSTKCSSSSGNESATGRSSRPRARVREPRVPWIQPTPMPAGHDRLGESHQYFEVNQSP